MSNFGPASIPRLVAQARLRHDPARDAQVLLFPEGVLVLNPSAATILTLCNGERTIGEIASTLAQQLDGRDVSADVVTLLDRLAAKGLVEDHAR